MTDDYGIGRKRGPYGTNPGDTWLATGSDIQRRLDRQGEGLVFVHYVNDDGEAAFYVTDNQEMIEEARAGHELYVAVRAMLN